MKMCLWLSLFGTLLLFPSFQIAGDSAGAETSDQQVHFWAIVVDFETDQPIPCRVHLVDAEGKWHLVQSVGGEAVHYERHLAHLPQSPEVHTTLSAAPFSALLPPGKYLLRVERGKEYLPYREEINVQGEMLKRTIRLRRWIHMSSRGWYSGDTHVHRSVQDLPNVMLAEDLNVAFPLSYWVHDSADAPKDVPAPAGEAPLPMEQIPMEQIEIDALHVIHPRNTEYEIFQVEGKRQTLGAVFVLNHKEPLDLKAPPTAPLAKLARDEGALLDLDKHSWPWSLMIVPIMDVDLFELSNNHVWQTEFGFHDWTLDTIAPYMNLQRNEQGLTEWGWIDYGFQTYYALVNCGFRMRVTAGTASGVHPVQLGFGRVYVHLPNGFSYDAWIEGLNAGNSFVTTGPMMDLRFNGQDAGHQFKIPKANEATVKISGTIESRRPLKTIEIVVNGEIVRSLVPKNVANDRGGFRNDLDVEVRREESFWTAVRCFEDHPQGRVRFAHSNPVYLDRDGSKVRPKKREVDHILYRLDVEMQRLTGVLGKEALDEFEKAKQIYQQIGSQAK